MVGSPLLTGDAAGTAALRARGSRVCVVYPDHPMPAGVDPSRARIGVEIDDRSGRTVLFVERGLRYTGVEPRVRAWVADGELGFGDLGEAQRWLTACVSGDPATQATVPVRRVAEIAPDLPTVVAAIPAGPLGGDAGLRSPEWLAAGLKETVRGQDAALDRLARHVVRHLARVRPRRPATFFLVGPTGVGKTRTATCLAELLDGQGRGELRYESLRLDKNEYRERHRVSRLLGAPPGYVGYSDGGRLADALARNSRQVILFDEIDKAHPDVLVVLMNLIDTGRLSRSVDGGEIEAPHAILLFTSNQAADELTRALAGTSADDGATTDELCRRELRRAGVAPELLGRVRCMLPYGPLDRTALAEIAVAAVRDAGTEFGLTVDEVDAEALRLLLDGYAHSSLGARPIEHAVEDAFGNALATAAESSGGAWVTCGHDGERFTVRPVRLRAGADTPEGS